MRTVVTAEEMRWCDEIAIRSYGIPGLLLMENAGRGVADIIKRSYGPLQGKRILVFCGKGNNGGDGFVVARLLQNEGAKIEVVLLVSPRQLSGDSKTNYSILKKIAAKSRSVFSIHRFTPGLLQRKSRPDIIIDGIFGTGFTGVPKKQFANVIDWINKQDAPIISIDIPSGVNGSTGEVKGTAVKATTTVTMGALKTGLLCYRGREHSGEIRVVDIGIPSRVFHHSKLKTRLIESSDVYHHLPKRSLLAHKYSVGKVFILAGAKNYTGAAVLTAKSCLRAGAGAVFLGVPDEVYQIITKKLTEPVVIPFPSTADGTFSESGKSEILSRMNWADVTIIGPGLSQNPETAQLVLSLLEQENKNVLLDADALNILSTKGPALLKKWKTQFILTPHSGELSRLSRKPTDELEMDRVESSKEFARKSGSVTVLKGAPTVTAHPSGEVMINSSGNPGMATVGSGDVLAGVIASLWAQGMKNFEAAYSGVYLHGLAGDLAKAQFGEKGLVAHDLIDYLPSAFLTFQQGNQS